jgi:hypothetical protein
VGEVLDYVIRTTPCLERHGRAALRSLENAGGILVEPLKASGKRRRANSFPEDAVVVFQ